MADTQPTPDEVELLLRVLRPLKLTLPASTRRRIVTLTNALIALYNAGDNLQYALENQASAAEVVMLTQKLDAARQGLARAWRPLPKRLPFQRVRTVCAENPKP